MAPPKKNRANPAQKAVARQMSSIVPSGGTGDPEMDATLGGEVTRKTMQKMMTTPVAAGAGRGQSTFHSMFTKLRNMFAHP